jgi:hypothetical protein
MITARQAVAAVLGGAPADRQDAATGWQRITWETVEAVDGRGGHSVLGRTLPVTGLATFPIGTRVPVAWKAGQPMAIIGHHWRRAQFHPSLRRTAQGIVEELLVADLDETQAEVWYRTATKLEKVETRPSVQGHAPIAVKWGLDGCSFALQCTGEYYAVFSFERDDPNTLDENFPGAATLVRIWKPLDSSAALTTVTFSAQVTKDVKVWTAIHEVEVRYHKGQSAWYDGGIWGWYSDTVLKQNAWEDDMDGSGSAASSATVAFPLKDLLAGRVADFDGDTGTSYAEVVDWFLDAQRHLQFVILAAWDWFRMGSHSPGSGVVTWPLSVWIDATGHYTYGPKSEAISAGAASGFIGAKRRSDQQTVDEQHIFLWDAETGTVAWSTASAAPSMGSESKTFACALYEHEIYTDPGYD